MNKNISSYYIYSIRGLSLSQGCTSQGKILGSCRRPRRLTTSWPRRGASPIQKSIQELQSLVLSELKIPLNI